MDHGAEPGLVVYHRQVSPLAFLNLVRGQVIRAASPAATSPGGINHSREVWEECPWDGAADVYLAGGVAGQ